MKNEHPGGLGEYQTGRAEMKKRKIISNKTDGFLILGIKIFTLNHIECVNI